jgi:hypothetical protein
MVAIGVSKENFSEDVEIDGGGFVPVWRFRNIHANLSVAAA